MNAFREAVTLAIRCGRMSLLEGLSDTIKEVKETAAVCILGYAAYGGAGSGALF